MKRHDHNFTSSAWSEATTILANRGMGLGKEIKCLKVWSDGGLKTKENLFFSRQLAMVKGITITVNFFGPYHGHSEVILLLLIFHFSILTDFSTCSVMGTLGK